MSVREIAETIAGEYPGECTIEHVDNPRVEIEDHYYNVTHTALEEPGPQADAARDDADRPAVRRRGAAQGPRRPGRDHARPCAGADDLERAAPSPPTRSPRREHRMRRHEWPPGPRHRRFRLHRPPRGRRAGRRGRPGPRRRPAAPPRPGGRPRPGDIWPSPTCSTRRFDGGFDAVVHLAAVTSVLRSLEQPELTYRTNVAATAGLLEAARAAGVRSLAFASTNAVTGPMDAPGDHRGRDAAAADAVRLDEGGGRDADVRLHGLLRPALRVPAPDQRLRTRDAGQGQHRRPADARDPPRRRRSRSTATAARSATTSTSATSSRRCGWRC